MSANERPSVDFNLEEAGRVLHTEAPEPFSVDDYVGKSQKSRRPADQKLLREIWTLLLKDKSLALSEIEIDVKDERIRLMGTVPELAVRDRLEDLIADCWGVSDIQNEIHILKPLGPIQN